MRRFIELFYKTAENEKSEQTVLMLQDDTYYVPVTVVIAEYKWMLRHNPLDPDKTLYRDFLTNVIPDGVIDELEAEYAKL